MSPPRPGGGPAREAASKFRLPAPPVSIRPFGSGHINDTYRIDCGPGSPGFVLQRLNPRVFPDPEGQLANIARVLEHLKKKEPDPRRTLSGVSAADGSPYWRDASGAYWRVARLIERTMVRNVATRPEEAREAARAFGRFLRDLSDLPGPRLAVTLPGFHDTPRRLAHFEGVAAADRLGRAREAKSEIDFIRADRKLASVIADARAAGTVPERVAHNDTKINNVLFDADTGEGLCVIDLDTVMPGTALDDFGDMVRSAINPARDDERDLSRIEVRLPVFEALARGYLEAAGEVLAPGERDLLALSGAVLAYELAIRFLADHLGGDRYFKIRREGQNLDRARTQIRLTRLLLEKESRLSAIIASV